MKNQPLVSVLMTSYNREKYIGSAIESVLASTYDNYELIIVDDCSTDRTVEIIQSFAGRDRRIRVFLNERNLGQFENRNLAATYAKGEYLKYLDSDDLLYPTGLEVLVNMMEQFPEAGYGLCSLEQDDDRIFPFMLTPAEAYERHFCKGISLFHKAPLSSIIKKDCFSHVGGFTNPAGEGDYEMWLVLSEKYNVVLMPHGVVWYRVHDEQVDFHRRTDPFLRFKYLLVTQKYLKENCPLDPGQALRVAKETQGNITKSIFTSFYKYSPAKARQMYRAANYTLPYFIKELFRAVLTKFK
jgi:glycosyltransferase involved in cell wall biosynthesis